MYQSATTSENSHKAYLCHHLAISSDVFMSSGSFCLAHLSHWVKSDQVLELSEMAAISLGTSQSWKMIPGSDKLLVPQILIWSPWVINADFFSELRVSDTHIPFRPGNFYLVSLRKWETVRKSLVSGYRKCQMHSLQNLKPTPFQSVSPLSIRPGLSWVS